MCEKCSTRSLNELTPTPINYPHKIRTVDMTVTFSLESFFSFRSQILQERGSRMWGEQEPELNNTESTKTNLLFLSLPQSSHHHCHSPCPSSCGVPFHSEAPWQSHLLQCCHTTLIHLVSSSLYVEHFSRTFKREYVSGFFSSKQLFDGQCHCCAACGPHSGRTPHREQL